ncbi:MAG: hypothetical protein BWZ10_01283 [candidate division BRC1 bacterium ADurb.BinA364]|nr:MAG: hypothetical protein BWZ10_01283 [candidate division BRC1 bacterium ADurb.BinA364]
MAWRNGRTAFIRTISPARCESSMTRLPKASKATIWNSASATRTDRIAGFWLRGPLSAAATAKRFAPWAPMWTSPSASRPRKACGAAKTFCSGCSISSPSAFGSRMEQAACCAAIRKASKSGAPSRMSIRRSMACSRREGCLRAGRSRRTTGPWPTPSARAPSSPTKCWKSRRSTARRKSFSIPPPRCSTSMARSRPPSWSTSTSPS